MPRLALLVVSLVVIVACKEANPSSCELPTNAGNPGCPDAATIGCDNDFACKDLQSTPACDTIKMQCVICTARNARLCLGTNQARCEDDECVACVDDGDCAAGTGTLPGTGICLTSGACASPMFLHVAPPGNGGAPCPASEPCSLDTALQIAKTSTQEVFIKVDANTTYTSAGNGFVVDSDTRMPITIDLGSAVLHSRGGDSPVFTIKSMTTATILGGTIENAMGPNGDGIRCDSNSVLTVRRTTVKSNAGSGISAVTSTLEVGQAQIGPGNANGGVAVNGGTFVLVGNAIVGNTGGNNPGVLINTPIDSTKNRFEFNTVANNVVNNGAPTAGVNCNAGTTIAFTAKNNIIWSNKDKAASALSQTSGTCAHSYSDIGATPYSGPAGTGNVIPPVDPGVTADGHAAALTLPKSADPLPTLTGIAERDIDKERRVAPADMGADQRPKPR